MDEAKKSNIQLKIAYISKTTKTIYLSMNIHVQQYYKQMDYTKFRIQLFVSRIKALGMN